MLLCVALTALAVRLPALLSPQALLPVPAPLGPLGWWLQPWLDSHAAFGTWLGLGVVAALADAASAVLLARLVERRRLAERLLSPKPMSEGWASAGFWAGLAWAAHPVAGLLAGPAGVWQSVALLGLLSAAWNLEYSVHPAAEHRAAWGFALAMGAALWPLLLLPLGATGLLSRRARARFYFQALLPALALGLPWLLLVSPARAGGMLLGPPSTLGVPGLLAALWSAAGAPHEMLPPLLQAWSWAALTCLAVYFLASLRRPSALLPGLALGAWVWVCLAPQPQGSLLLAPLALALTVPGGLSLRLGTASFALLVLQGWLPGLRDLQLGLADTLGQWRGTHLLWAAIQLAWLFYVGLDLARLRAYARGPRPHRSVH